MRLVTPGDGPVRPVDRVALSAEIYWSYLCVRWLLRGGDANAAVPRLRRIRPLHHVDPAHAEFAARRLAWAVIRALEPLPADSRCLYRSLTLTCLLERRGISSDVVIAVRPAPFAAHAWVARGDVPLLPAAEAGFERLARL